MLTVYLADLRHDYQGVLTSDTMPLGIGYIKSYMDKKLNGMVNSTLFVYPEDFLNAIKTKVPDVLMVTNYMWNENLNYHFCKLVKKINPAVFVIMGGPNLPLEDNRKIEFLKKRSAIDLYVYGEGDFIASEIIEKFIESKNNIPQTLNHHFHSSIYQLGAEENRWVINPILPRTKDLDEIPSPWLTGIMDKFFDGKLAPLWETNRGCPFTCTFCVQGTKWYTKVNYFSLERLKEEIFYIGKIISKKCPQQKVLRIADSNYGMFERDIEISSFIGMTQKEYDYPRFIDATTGKNKADRIIKSLEKVNGALILYQAVQSLDNEVLKNIKRSNIQLDAYEKVQIELQARGMRASSDLILGLPGDSLESHLGSLQKLLESGTNKINTFQGIMLKGSEMEREIEREQFKLKTKFRLSPKNFGIYGGEIVLDYEEIIVSNDKLNFDDYLTARVYHFIINVFINYNRFQPLIKILQNNKIKVWEWIKEIYQFLVNDKGTMSDFLYSFLKETQKELFDSEEQLIDFYSDKNNFEKLFIENSGGNLIYKFCSEIILMNWHCVVDVAVDSLKSVLGKNDIQVPAISYADLKTLLTNRYIWGTNADDLFISNSINLDTDIEKWINNNQIVEENARYFLEPNPEYKKYIENTLKIWGFNKNSIFMFIRRVDINWFKKNEIKQIISVDSFS